MRIHDEEHGVDVAAHDRSGRQSEPSLAGLAGHRMDVLGRDSLLRLQREAGNGAVSGLVAEQEAEPQRSPVLDVVQSGGGSPLEGGVREDMESRLGADFSDVRVHTGADAHTSAQSVGAHAYTVGSNVVFQRDAYDPSSTAGRTTLAHELTHVMQQRSGPVDGSPAGGGVSVSDPGDRFETAAAENATRVMSEPAPVQRETDASAASSAASVQREGEEEEEPVQGLFVQREEAAEEAEEEQAEGA
ncbi:DUF4157 domain-containing protein [Agromyces sp. CFH 90414]|uniref:DUF4157 domain-containing protein n=1 Tax=Agromyces agglutinans TaxID=2662258 RepID=A0A6I2F258_9MICO|nr:DUF4157 domain-containing protein [Agromyces agglutinans]MRG59575.1 DUF4157 domain-containing protein [Agromyces agglutinans]